jgi:predicted ribosome quality control (RQC) complex YloA/Tae2 family protein
VKIHVRIPFDSLCVAAIVAELQSWVGAKAQKWVMTDARTLCVQLYLNKAAWMTLSWDPNFTRMHLGPGPDYTLEPDHFVKEIRKKLHQSILKRVVQIERDRIVDMQFESEEGKFRLVLELTGSHGNCILCTHDGRAIAAAKWIGASKSDRPIQPAQPYSLPEASGRFSTFLTKLEPTNSEIDRWFAGKDLSPVLVEGAGAYPVSVKKLLPDEVKYPTLSEALLASVAGIAQKSQLDSARNSLMAILERVHNKYQKAIIDLEGSLDSAARAAEFQLQGELILAYGFSAKPDANELDVFDYEGNPIKIKFDPEKSVQENAEKLFKKAKNAKSRVTEVQEQHAKMSEILADVRVQINNLLLYESIDDINKLHAYALHKKWFVPQNTQAKKEDRPFAGHKIRELVGPNGFTVLYGENSEANDYLTLRVGKPNDWWLHVRGGPSAHVIILTQGQPDKVPKAVLEFAAEVAVRNSPLKHSSYVPVDYTLKKFVRRPKGAAIGMVNYTREKTLHVDARKS